MCFFGYLTSASGQITPVETICTTLKTYMDGKLAGDLTTAQDFIKRGDLNVIETNLPTTTLSLAVKETITPRTERLYIWEPVEERLEYCRILCVFFEIINETTNAVVLKAALDNQTSTAPTSISFASKIGKKNVTILLKINRLTDGSNKATEVVMEGISGTKYDKRCRLPTNKPLDPLTNASPYLMNLEIKDIQATNPVIYQTWSRWTTDFFANKTIHKKYINIHLNIKQK